MLGKTIVFLKEEQEELFLLLIYLERATYHPEMEVREFSILTGKKAIF